MYQPVRDTPFCTTQLYITTKGKDHSHKKLQKIKKKPFKLTATFSTLKFGQAMTTGLALTQCSVSSVPPMQALCMGHGDNRELDSGWRTLFIEYNSDGFQQGASNEVTCVTYTGNIFWGVQKHLQFFCSYSGMTRSHRQTAHHPGLLEFCVILLQASRLTTSRGWRVGPKALPVPGSWTCQVAQWFSRGPTPAGGNPQGCCHILPP